MTTLVALYDRLTRRLVAQAGWLLPSLSRLIFAGVLAGYFWSSALTKLSGPFGATVGGYGQIFPRMMESVGFATSAMPFWTGPVVVLGAWAELVLPLLIVLGLLTRFAALGMLGFVALQSLTDILGHGVKPGAWFDRASDAVIADQRAFWVLLFLTLLLKGAGPLSLDRVWRQWASG